MIVDIGKLSKPVDTLIKKVSNATGILYEPHHIKRIAKAKAKADLIAAQSNIDITDLHRRAANRWINEEAKRQANMENILAKALPEVKISAKPNYVEDDWIVNFFDKSRIVSDSQMQELWSKILAGETNSPGSYSKRTVNFLSDFEKSDAELFTKLCGFVWNFEYPIPLVFKSEAEIYNRFGINFVSLQHLDSIGLINFNSLTGFTLPELPKKFKVYYYGRPLLMDRGNDASKVLPLGTATFTAGGIQIATICDGIPVDGFWDYVKVQWKKFLLVNRTA